MTPSLRVILSLTIALEFGLTVSVMDRVELKLNYIHNAYVTNSNSVSVKIRLTITVKVSQSHNNSLSECLSLTLSLKVKLTLTH